MQTAGPRLIENVSEALMKGNSQHYVHVLIWEWQGLSDCGGSYFIEEVKVAVSGDLISPSLATVPWVYCVLFPNPLWFSSLLFLGPSFFQQKDKRSQILLFDTSLFGTLIPAGLGQ